MVDLKEYTPTELLKLGNDTATKHDVLKKEISDLTYEMDAIVAKINGKISEMEIIEKLYVDIVEEISER